MNRIATAVLLLAALLLPGAASRADELKVMSAIIMQNGLKDAAANFERMTGIKLTLAYDTAGNVKSKIEKGEAADVVILPKPDIAALVKAKKVAADSVHPVASTALGVGVKKGQPKPDISSVAAVKKALLEAKSIAYFDPKLGGAAGVLIQRDIGKLGIAKQIAAKVKPWKSDQEVNDEKSADLIISWQPIIMSKSADYDAVGTLPAPLQEPERGLFVAGAVAKSADLESAKDLSRVLASPESLNAFKAKGFTPPS